MNFQGAWDQIDPSAFFSTLTSPVFWCEAGSFFHKTLKLWCTKAAKWNKRQDKIGDDVVSEKNGYLKPLLKAFLIIIIVIRNYFTIFEQSKDCSIVILLFII